MKTLLKQTKRISYKPIYNFFTRILLCGMGAFYLTVLAEASLLTQLFYISVFCASSLILDYFSSKTTQAIEVKFDGKKLSLLGTNIQISDVHEILYSQTKRFEHTVRFRYRNQTYQDFELASSDLIDDLRFYHFLVENQLPVKMLDCSERVI
ncbi:hypothetical protein [Vibrio nigripulchritudo]|uniref:hypothetical protein n=1 Tax=Vibrio nigripulchritudo TaxID=28173 RepID=UPI0003B18ECD|nr:hypothetical protein [Vibrio nigripulchritudo]CCN70077.1 conserved exported hypothetical protein [Vibrio nigripulchritudo SFn118]